MENGKNLNRVIFGAIVVLICFGEMKAQTVTSKSYQTMLSVLLSHNVPEISVHEIDIANGGAVWLDAREQNEYAVSYIAGARWVGYDDFDLTRVDGISKNQPVIVYCSVGYRSEKIAEQLMAAGYTNVSNLYGGIFEWKNQDREVVDAEGRSTERVHAYNRIWGKWLRKGKKVYDH